MPEVARAGVRGYIVSRPVRGSTYPQRVQNLVVRDFTRRRGLAYRLSVTEYAMPGCFMVLEQLLAEAPSLEGIVLFSAFTLPPERPRRRAVIDAILAAGARLYAALEDITVSDRNEADALDELLDVAALLPITPFGGRYEKGPLPLGPDPDGAALLAAST